MKKRLCFMLSLMFILAGAVPAFAAETQSKGLEQAVLTVKSAVTIPADYSDFSYSSYEEDQGNGAAVTAWNLEWGKADGSAGISAGVDELGNLLRYSKYVDMDESGLSKITREEGRKTADAFLAKAMPSLAAQMKPVDEKENASSTWNLPYSYQLEMNGLPVPFIHAEITINKYTGELQQFNGLNAGQKLPEFPDAKPAYTAEQAAALYSEKLEPELRYFTYFDYKTKKLSVFPGYQMSGSGGKAIDAQTGEVVQLLGNYETARAQDESAKESGGDNSAYSGLTPEEQAAVDQVSGLISKEKAESILKGTFDLSGQKTTASNLRSDYAEKDRYFWNISFDQSYGQVDAKTGEITSFNYYSDYDNAEASVTPEQASKTVETFLKDIAPEKLAKTRLENMDDMIAAYESEKETLNTYRFYYIRLENGSGVNGNGLSVTVNAATGKIMSYSNQWYQSISFPSIEKAMDGKTAFEHFNSESSLRLAYAQTSAGKVVLVYDFEKPATTYLVDPFTGEALGWDGKPYESELRPEYSDISGHWAEKTISALLDNGYYLPGDKFQPDLGIQQEEFLRYMYGRSQANDDSEDFYKMLERSKIVTAAEKAPTKVMTRQEAAKFMVRYLGFNSVAVRSEIFKDLFQDKVEESYKGYAAICSGLNIMKGDSGGRFNGTASMTRAEAASALYQLFEVK